MAEHVVNEDARERIIGAASDRFMDEGFSSVPVEEIAASLGMSKKTFYKHFTSKEELLGVVTERILEGVHRQFTAIVERDTPFPEKLESLVTFLGERLTRLGRPMMRDLQRHSPLLWDRVQRFRRERISNDFKRLLLRGADEGFVRTDVDIDLFLRAFIGAVEAVVNPAVIAESSLSVREVVRSIMTVFLRGILTAGAGDALAEQRSVKTDLPNS